MKDTEHLNSPDLLPPTPSAGGGAAPLKQTTRRGFLQAAGLGTAALAAYGGSAYGAEEIVDKYGEAGVRQTRLELAIGLLPHMNALRTHQAAIAKEYAAGAQLPAHASSRSSVTASVAWISSFEPLPTRIPSASHP